METTTNSLKRFKRLIGSESRQIATVLTVYTDGTSLVEGRNGQRFIARGDSVIAGQRAWIVNAEIKSQAPNLPFYSVTV